MPDVPPLRNLFDTGGLDFAGERFETLAGTSAARVERIVSLGHATPDDRWYDQDQDEWVVLLSGGARLLFDGDGGAVTLRPGDWLTIPAHSRHRVAWTDPATPTVWLAVHLAPP